ncbi:hypothetical protein N7462_002425 [Penicillium macrosclerotiorum]|uniref:uncharacterized protein n=1 Tax=Penicillium macrosclerotiorum TaxID=303699 RepID=UPI0025487A34|nr:uncharacterized protein N7462_002425 [Penicillium macrosclerotiorum]KAJ5693002.1 hypothetical protein N7462_002425 [Penicillium macrosclerotiorum]
MWQFLDQHIGLFLRVDNRTMLFVHDTAKHSILKYSEETAEDGFSIFSHTMLATLCVRHLCTFLPEYQPHMEKLHKGDAFIPYAAKQWARHYHLGIQDAVSDEADDASTELESLIEEFISSQDQRDSWYAIVHPELTEFDKSGDIPTKLEMASELGLARIVGEAIKNRDNDEIDDKVLERSLRLATKYGHGNIVNLITQTEVSVSSALPFSTEQDKVQILQHFLEIDRKKSFHFATTDISAALESAAQNGHLEAVRLILAHTKGIQEYEVVHDLPLEEAADRGHMEILDYLLQYVKELPETEKADQEPPAQEERISDEDQKIEDKEDDLEVKDSGQQAAAGEPQSEDVVESKSEPEDEESVSENEKPSIEDMKKGALYRACRRGNEEMVRLLLQHGIKPTHKAINITAEAGYSDIMKLILEALDPQNADDVKLNETFALSKAAENGHLAVVKLLLDNNVSIDGLSPEEDTPLHRAAANGYVEVCRLLISQGANPNGIKDDKMTPAQLAADGGYLSTFQALQECPDPSNYYNYIRLAAENGHVLMVRYLLGLDQELDPKNNELESALATVASKGYLAVTRELCKAGVEVNRRTGNHSAIHNAAGKGHVQLVEYLLTQGADVNACGDLRRTPLHEAVKYPEILAMLLDHGAHVDVTDLDDRTPLHAAIGAKEETSTEDDLERSVRMLIEANADVDAKDEDGNTPLHLAARVSFEAAVDALLERSAKATGANEDKNTVLHLAAKFSSPAIMKSLLGASTGGCDSTNEESKTPLNIAAARGENTIVLLLVEETSDKAINTADEDGKTPLHYVARNSDGEALKALVAAGADINAKDASQATALINAATRGDLETAKLLLECGADMEIIDKNNDTALLASIPENYVDIARLLLEKGANVSAVETYGNAPLLLAALDGHKDMVQLLLESGANIDQANDDKWTPLAAAITNDHADIASILVDHGANIEAMNTFGSTPCILRLLEATWKSFVCF